MGDPIRADQTSPFTTSATQLIQSLWAPAMRLHHSAQLRDTHSKVYAIPAELARTILWATWAGEWASERTRLAMSSRMFWRSMTLYQVVKRMWNVRIASTGNSTKATAAIPLPALPLPAAPAAQQGRRRAKHQVGGAAWTKRPLQNHQLHPPPPPPPQQHQPAPARAKRPAGLAGATTRPARLPRPRRHPRTRHPRLPGPCPRLVPRTCRRPDGKSVSSGIGTVRAVDGKATIQRSIYDLRG